MSRSMPALPAEAISPAFDHSNSFIAKDRGAYCKLLGADPRHPESFIQNLPFAPGDATAGTENELQSAVKGAPEDVDLPSIIAASNYLKNIRKRSLSGEAPAQLVTDLEQFLADNPGKIWENSWVRFPKGALNETAMRVLNHDLLEDKRAPQGPMRGDARKFSFKREGREFFRLPISYILKISLAQALGEMPPSLNLVRELGHRMMSHFSNDNTSPETFSFYTVKLRRKNRMGRGIAGETALRFLVCQALIQYANRSFGLLSQGQEAVLYMAPNPPTRQKALNDLISDAFYRDLFMSPCLSGWDRGEDKHKYMALCHQVLSRSQLNAVAKLREAHIINNNLVVLPNTSNVSLANNGTHLSLGSLKLGRLLTDPNSGFGAHDEKYLGDLVIKFCEHFLPLFVGTYSAAPYRLDFTDFHPEKALGYLPHELDFTHLRMIWRRWKKKAKLKILGQPCTPFGPLWLDRPLRKVFGLCGDFVPDFRLIDYLVTLKSTEESHALDGTLGNDLRLKRDLDALGVFDESMSLYLLYKQRQFAFMGFSGFEGRHYSLFESLSTDMVHAANLQTLITAYAFKCILNGKISHEDLPSDPFTESERRQVFFGAAIGIPTFFVNKKTKNRFMLRVLRDAKKMRFSRRYPGYLRVYNLEYRIALINMIRAEAQDLIELMGMEETVQDLEERVRFPEKFSAAGKLTESILEKANAKKPMELSGREFAQAAEYYYRNDLRMKHMCEACDFLSEELERLDGKALLGRGRYREMLNAVLEGEGALQFLSRVKLDILRGDAPASVLERFLALCIIAVGAQLPEYERILDEPDEKSLERVFPAPIHSA
ncbi:hypothetical protein SAMN02745216_03986 [Desulfatibacillum alkenivorans DSM 16219]|jgi:hypothetical protein|uniref:Uncharacterized protein n=1 Tax=Desulfatibacillum alkenivorans DSM 16219 TaxID=1121393 RepID=A0A1M6UW67_9BACT|nr:hypothetical protein [Desulfatibacillum alkenivorans]SHK73306.1 hypothetical protein SAMN02745216_03986 [Desulfatibacillum alkenivorans DSM 16219]